MLAELLINAVTRAHCNQPRWLNVRPQFKEIIKILASTWVAVAEPNQLQRRDDVGVRGYLSWDRISLAVRPHGSHECDVVRRKVRRGLLADPRYFGPHAGALSQ